MPPQKGKQPTKGAKQIVEENRATINFYRNMSLGACVFYGVVMGLLYLDSLTAWYIALTLFALGAHTASYQMMKYMSKATYSSTNQLIDSGLDLNMEGGMAEHIKDIVILTSITQVLAVFSNYFWLLLLLLPIRVMMLIWKTILGPWFFQEAPEDTEQDEKKKKKMERKMKRYQQ